VALLRHGTLRARTTRGLVTLGDLEDALLQALLDHGGFDAALGFSGLAAALVFGGTTVLVTFVMFGKVFGDVVLGRRADLVLTGFGRISGSGGRGVSGSGGRGVSGSGGGGVSGGHFIGLRVLRC
jgi:hypothetical protein